MNHSPTPRRGASRLLAVLCLASTLPANASTLQVLDYFNFIDNRQNSAIGAGGVFLNVGTDLTPPGGTTVTATQGTVVKNLTVLSPIGAPDQFISNRYAYTPSLTGAWTIHITNPGATNGPVDVTTLPICPTLCSGAYSPTNPFLTPFITDVLTNGLSTTPTFSWAVPSYTPPAGTVAGLSLNVFVQTSTGAYTLLSATPLAANATSFTVPTNQQLVSGLHYVISVQTNLYNTADAGGGSRGSTVEESRSLFSFEPNASAAAFSGPVALPVVDANGRFSFNLAVVNGAPVLLDPTVATGFDYRIGQGDPLFASVTLPDLGSFSYAVYLWDGMQWVFDTQLAALSTFNFDGGGVDRFRISGIPLDQLVDPTDPEAFVTRVTFAGDGRFTGTMTALLASSQVPEPAMTVLVAVGLAGWLVSRRPRRQGFRSQPSFTNEENPA